MYGRNKKTLSDTKSIRKEEEINKEKNKYKRPSIGQEFFEEVSIVKSRGESLQSVFLQRINFLINYKIMY